MSTQHTSLDSSAIALAAHAENLQRERDELLAALREAEALIPELVRQCPNGAPMSVAAAHDRIRAAIAKATEGQS